MINIAAMNIQLSEFDSIWLDQTNETYTAKGQFAVEFCNDEPYHAVIDALVDFGKIELCDCGERYRRRDIDSLTSCCDECKH